MDPPGRYRGRQASKESHGPRWRVRHRFFRLERTHLRAPLTLECNEWRWTECKEFSNRAPISRRIASLESKLQGSLRCLAGRMRRRPCRARPLAARACRRSHASRLPGCLPARGAGGDRPPCGRLAALAGARAGRVGAR